MTTTISPGLKSAARRAGRKASRSLWTVALAALLGCEAEAPSTPMAKPASDAAASSTPASGKDAEANKANGADAGGASETAGKTDPANAGGAAAGSAAAGAGQPLAIDNVSFTVPGGWVAKPVPPGGFIDAEFALPKAEGDDADGRLTLSRAGGAVEANIDRWRGQFGGKPEKDEVKTLEVAGAQVTWVDLAGEFNDSRGPVAPPKMKAGYRMLAAIIPAGDFSIFVKATGPQKTLESHAESLMAFVKTAKIEKP